MNNDDFEVDLERRLSVIEDPGYEDPARRDLPAGDLVVLTVVGALVIALMFWWGYPA